MLIILFICKESVPSIRGKFRRELAEIINKYITGNNLDIKNTYLKNMAEFAGFYDYKTIKPLYDKWQLKGNKIYINCVTHIL